MNGDNYVIDENGSWNSQYEALLWYRSEVERLRLDTARLDILLHDRTKDAFKGDRQIDYRGKYSNPCITRLYFSADDGTSLGCQEIHSREDLDKAIKEGIA